MFDFEVLKKSKKSNARLGLLQTSNGVVETPCFIPVATQAVIKTLTSQDVINTKSQCLIVNTFHLYLRGCEKIVRANKGLHKFMHWDRPLMTDSGGFQVFSLGFGKDFGMGKILKKQSIETVQLGQQPKLLKITNDGVLFTSYLNGQEVFIGPAESMRIQGSLGADIIFAFDECPSPVATVLYIKDSLIRTHKWAKICLDTKPTKQALYGIVQGGKHKTLRSESAKFIGALPFDGFGVGGEFGYDKKEMAQILNVVTKELPSKKPIHLLGVGYLEDIINVIKSGVDTFDCIVPTHYARRGIAFTSHGELNMNKQSFLKDKKSLDKNCSCFVCVDYNRSYITHLLRAKELTAFQLLSFHNLYFFNTFVEKIRLGIKKGTI